MENKLKDVIVPEASNSLIKRITDTSKVQSPDITFDKRVSISFNTSKLPSRGISYDTVENVRYYPYNIGELKRIQQNKMTDLEIIDFVLQHIETTFDKEKLTYFDFLFLSILLKISVLGEEAYTVKFTCPSCGTQQVRTFKLSNIEFMDVEYEKLPLIITVDDIDYHFMPLTVGDMKKAIKANKGDDYNYLMSLQLVNQENPLQVIETVFAGANTRYLVLAEKILDHSNSSVVFKCEGKVDNDGKAVECESNVAIPFLDIPEFVTTIIQPGDPILSSIRFGS